MKIRVYDYRFYAVMRVSVAHYLMKFFLHFLQVRYSVFSTNLFHLMYHFILIVDSDFIGA